MQLTKPAQATELRSLSPVFDEHQEGDGMVTAQVFDPIGARGLNEVEWHDSVLLSLEFDRTVEKRDELRLHLLVLVDPSTWESEEWLIALVPRWTPEKRPFVDGSKPAISGAG